MKRLFIPFFLAGAVVLVSCAPVLDKSYMREGDRSVSFGALSKASGQYKGRLFIMGGVILQTRLTETGAEIVAMHVPVDAYGYFEDRGRSEGRYLALLPAEEAMLDPIVYHRARRVTLAAEFVGTRPDRIDEMMYVYPLFRIRQIYIWPPERLYYHAPYYYDPRFYPYPPIHRYVW